MGLSNEEVKRRNEERRMKKWNELHKIIDGIDHKLCNRCELYYPATTENFYKNDKNGIDGLYPYCVVCAKIKADKWAADNRERNLELKRRSNKRPKALIRQTENTRRRRKEGYFKKFFIKHPNKQREYNKRHGNKKHMISDKEWDACRLYFDYRCAYCGKSWEQNKLETKKDLHKEHAHDDGLNDLSNCVPACRDCNSKKHEKELTVWFNEITITEERKFKIIKWLEHDHLKYIENNS